MAPPKTSCVLTPSTPRASYHPLRARGWGQKNVRRAVERRCRDRGRAGITCRASQAHPAARRAGSQRDRHIRREAAQRGSRAHAHTGAQRRAAESAAHTGQHQAARQHSSWGHSTHHTRGVDTGQRAQQTAAARCTRSGSGGRNRASMRQGRSREGGGGAPPKRRCRCLSVSPAAAPGRAGEPVPCVKAWPPSPAAADGVVHRVCSTGCKPDRLPR